MIGTGGFGGFANYVCAMIPALNDVLFNNPEFGWVRSDFSMAIAVQNLAWGIGQPIFGALAEKFGDRRAIIAGALLYSAGLLLSSYTITPGRQTFRSSRKP